MRFAVGLFVVCVLLAPAYSQTCSGNTCTAATCGSTDVQNALNAATGAYTTVVIPSGTCNWTTQVSLTVPTTLIKIQGQSSITGNCSPISPSCTAADNTVIVDNYASTNALFNLTTPSGCSSLEVTGITFKKGTGSVKQIGLVAVGGSCHSFRFDHNHFAFSTSILSDIILFSQLLDPADAANRIRERCGGHLRLTNN